MKVTGKWDEAELLRRNKNEGAEEEAAMSHLSKCTSQLLIETFAVSVYNNV